MDQIATVLDLLENMDGDIDFYIGKEELYRTIKKRIFLISKIFHERVGNKDKMTLENLYRAVRTHGYNMTRRTFQRDIEHMEILGTLKREVHKGGKYGNTTFLTLKN